MAAYGPWLKPPWPTGGSVYRGAAAMGSTLSAGRAQCKPIASIATAPCGKRKQLQAQARGATMAPPLGPESPGNGPAGAPTLGVAAAICTASSRARNRAQSWRANFKFRMQLVAKTWVEFSKLGCGAQDRLGSGLAHMSLPLAGHQARSASRHRSGTPSSNRCIALSASGVGSASRLTR
jgi:hypothetical protein